MNIDTYRWLGKDCNICGEKYDYLWTDKDKKICVCPDCFTDIPKHIPLKQQGRYIKRKGLTIGSENEN